VPPAIPISDHRQNEIFGRHAARPLPLISIFIVFDLKLRQALGSQHVFRFRWCDSNASAPNAPCVTCGCRRKQSLSRLRDAKLWPDDVMILDSYYAGRKDVRRAPGNCARALRTGQCVRVENGEQTVLRGNRMVHHGKGKLRLANFAPRGFQSRKGLRRSAFVDQ